MAQYGQPIVGTVEPWRQHVYDLFVTYYNNPLMIKHRNEGNYSIYMARVHALLGAEYRYLIAIVYKDNHPLNTTLRLSMLYWVSFQTRVLTVEYPWPGHEYTPRLWAPLNIPINMVYSDAKETRYKTSNQSLPILITLLPSRASYNTTGTVLNALETFQTIITFDLIWPQGQRRFAV
jgi:hypothetical protein